MKDDINNKLYGIFFAIYAVNLNYFRQLSELIVGENNSIYFQMTLMAVIIIFYFLFYFIYIKMLNVIIKLFNTIKINKPITLINIDKKNFFITLFIATICWIIYTFTLIIYKLIIKTDPNFYISIIGYALFNILVLIAYYKVTNN